MTTSERVLSCLQQAAASDAELAQHPHRTAWEGWCDLRRVVRWLSTTEGRLPSEETVTRALAQQVKAGRVEARDDRWRIAAA